MFKNVLAATVVALAALPVAAASVDPAAIPGADTIGKQIYVKETGEVTVSYIGSDAGNTNFTYFVKSGADQLLYVNTFALSTDAPVSLGSFAAGSELVFSLTSVGGGSAVEFLTGTQYAKAGDTAAYGFVVAFEDLLAGDFDYNDMVLGVSNATNELPPVPVPAALPLLASAFGGLAFLRRRKQA